MKVEYKDYIKTAKQPMTPWQEGMKGIEIPKGHTPVVGDMVAKNGSDIWLVTKEFFDTHYKETDLESKTLGNTTASQAKDNVKDIEFWGDGDTFKLISKAWSERQGWMKSTKGMDVGVGVVVQVTTQQKNPNGSYSFAEAVTFVPKVKIIENLEKGKVVSRYIGR